MVLRVREVTVLKIAQSGGEAEPRHHSTQKPKVPKTQTPPAHAGGVSSISPSLYLVSNVGHYSLCIMSKVGPYSPKTYTNFVKTVDL